MKKIIIAATILVMFLLSRSETSAEEGKVYILDLKSISDDFLSNTIKSLSIVEGSNEYQLYFNGSNVGNSYVNNGLLKYTFIQNGVTYQVECQINTLQVRVSCRVNNDIGNTMLISLETVNGIDTVYVYPRLAGNEDAIILEGTHEGGFTVFDEAVIFSGQNNQKISFLLDRESNMFYINFNGVTYPVECSSSKQQQIVFLETLVPEGTLSTLNLQHYDFAQAQTVHYSDDVVDGLARTIPIVLESKKTGLTYPTTLAEYISYWERIGDEEYNMDQGYYLTQQVICQFGDEGFELIRNYDEKTYSVYGNSFQYQVPEYYTKVEVVKDYDNPIWSNWMSLQDYNDSTDEKLQTESKEMKRYGIVTEWSNYKYSDKPIDDNSLTKVEEQYSYRTADYSAWSDYIYEEEDARACASDQYCQYDSKLLYSKSTASWSAYSTYKYTSASSEYQACLNDTNCRTSSKTAYALVNGSLTGKYSSYTDTCTNSEDYRCLTYYKYTCKYLLSKTVYSDISYAVGSSGPCSGNAIVSKKETGYRKAYVSFNEPSSYPLNTCKSNPGYSKCFSQVMYALSYRSWSDYSKYTDTVCTANETTRCRSHRLYALRTAQWTSYSDWKNSLPTGHDFLDYKTRWRYQTRSIKEYGYGETVPSGAIFLNYETCYRYLEPSPKSIYTDMVRSGWQTLGEYQHLTANEINELANIIAINKEKVEIIERNRDELSKDEFNRMVANFNFGSSSYYNSAKNSFLNSVIFAPDIYVAQHYRAVYQLMPVDVYNASLIMHSGDESYEEHQFTGILDEMEQQYSDNSKVVFIDKYDPFANYEQLPSNWIGEESLINRIRTINSQDADVVIRLSKQDIDEIRENINEENLLDKFRRIFVKRR